MQRKTNNPRCKNNMYFNDNNDFATKWLSNLFNTAVIDNRDIRQISAEDLKDHQRCHFFAGIGGWEYALQLAEWPINLKIWSGSCPCQPFSNIGNKKGEEDERHLWPEFRRLIEECKPPTIVGEQVASPLGREWLSGVRSDLEKLGYEVGAADLCAASVGAPHIRQRLFWVADYGFKGLGNPEGLQQRGTPYSSSFKERKIRRSDRNISGMGNSFKQGLEGYSWNEQESHESGWKSSKEDGLITSTNVWNTSSVAICKGLEEESDKKRRFKSESFPMAYGISSQMGPARAILKGMGCGPKEIREILRECGAFIKRANKNQVERLKGYGNAIVPEVAAEFIKSYMEVRGIR